MQDGWHSGLWSLAALLGLSIRRGDVGLAAASPIGLLSQFVSASLFLSPAPTLRPHLSVAYNQHFRSTARDEPRFYGCSTRSTVSRSLDIDSRTSIHAIRQFRVHGGTRLSLARPCLADLPLSSTGHGSIHSTCIGFRLQTYQPKSPRSFLSFSTTSCLGQLPSKPPAQLADLAKIHKLHHKSSSRFIPYLEHSL
jgi:hypothetical protein